MKLLIIILNKEENLDELLEGFLEIDLFAPQFIDPEALGDQSGGQLGHWQRDCPAQSTSSTIQTPRALMATIPCGRASTVRSRSTTCSRTVWMGSR